MKVNYVLMYGTPYLKYKEFEKFDEISKYLVNKGICNYRIFEPMEDLKEMEMIHLENDVRVLEGKIKQLQSQLKAKEEAEKEFIKYLEEEIEHNTPRARWKHYNEDGFNDYDVENGDYIKAQPVNITIKEIIEKYNEILSKGDNK